MAVPHYITAKTKTYLLAYKKFYISVYHYIPGEKPESISKEHIEQLALFLAAFHNQGDSINLDYSKRRKFYYLPPAIVKKMAPLAQQQQNALLKKIIPEIQKGVLHYAPPKRLPIGPIHVDIKPENELFLNNKLSGIIDFGNFYQGPFMIDVGKTIMWNCIHQGELDLTLTALFWETYQQHRHTTREEKQYFWSSILYAIYSHIWCDLYHVPLGYVPESYTLSLVEDFLPAAKDIIKKISRSFLLELP